jgi:transcriptional regulator with XRE-family HTH domain
MQELFSEIMRERLRSARKETGMAVEDLADGTGFRGNSFEVECRLTHGRRAPSSHPVLRIAAWTALYRVLFAFTPSASSELRRSGMEPDCASTCRQLLPQSQRD